MSTSFLLPGKSNADIIERQVENQSGYQVMKKTLEKKGYEFINSRAQIFITFDQSQPGSAPSLLCIIPSLVALDLKKDPDHKASGIVAFINGGQYAFMATEVVVNHKPFQVTSYALYGLNETTQKVDLFKKFSREEIAEGEVNKLAAKIKFGRVSEKDMLKVNIPEDDFAYIIKTSLSSFLNDEYTRHFPMNYKSSMLREASIVTKFSQAIALRKISTGSLSAACCSCTCCNGCTTTSTSWSVTWNAKVNPNPIDINPVIR